MRRKLRSVCAALLLLAGSVAVSQAQQFYWGPKAGVNVSSLTKTTYSKARTRANFGLFAGYEVNHLAAIQVEALYSLQGSKLRGQDHTYSYNYFKVPVLAKIYLLGGLNVEGGISFNWLTRAQEKWTDGDITHSRSVKGSVKDFDLTIPIGVNYQFLRFLDVGLRYDISTVRVPEDKVDKAKNSNWSINIGLRF